MKTDDEAKAEMRDRGCTIEILGTWKNPGPAEKKGDFVIAHDDGTFSAAKFERIRND